MASVLIPQKASSGLGMIGQAAPIVGSFFGPVGAAIGKGVGMVAGGLAQKKTDQQAQIAAAGAASEPKDIAPPPSDAMARRAQKIEDDPYEAVRKARTAIEYAPKELQAEYKDQLDEAMRIAEMQRNMA